MSRGESEIVEPTQVERALARRVAESRATVPDLELGVEVEMSASVALAQARGTGITAALLRACALALREHPRANAAYRDGRFELYSSINIGVVMPAATPTLFDAADKPLTDLDAELESLSERGERGELRPPELSGATFTLADLGRLGIDRPGIVITPPHAAAIAAGAIREAAVARQGAIVPGLMMQLTLAADQRILYGAHAARFLGRIKQLLEVGSL
jgi:pyruvate dehydrogenase E2 component (dihydrolipoamide acetyltransferase)